jgi:hypothetical protein
MCRMAMHFELVQLETMDMGNNMWRSPYFCNDAASTKSDHQVRKMMIRVSTEVFEASHQSILKGLVAFRVVVLIELVVEVEL